MLFRGKNKEYGAYYMRRNYSNHLLQGLFFFTSILITLIISYSIYNFIIDVTKPKLNYTSHGEIQLMDLTVKNEEPIKEIQKPKTNTTLPEKLESNTPVDQEKFVPATIVDQAKYDNESKPTSDIEASTKNLGSNDIVGINKTGSSPGIETNTTGTKNTQSEGNDFIYEFTEFEAKFPGGEEALVRYIQNKLVKPDYSREMGVTGTILIRFVVNEDGSCTNFSVLQSLNKELDHEALRVLSKMPKWIPAKQGGHQVKVYMDIPITFVDTE